MLKNVQKRQSTFLRRKQIIDASRKLILKYGSEHVTVKRIAKEIGISDGAIYKHFKSKRQILFFLVDYIEDNLIGDIKKSYPFNNVSEILKNILINHLSSIEQRRGISFLIIAEIISLGDKKLNRKIFDVLNKYIGHIKDILLKGVETGEIKQDIDLEMAAMIFFGMIQGLASIWALSNYNFILEQKSMSIWKIFNEAVTKR